MHNCSKASFHLNEYNRFGQIGQFGACIACLNANSDVNTELRSLGWENIDDVINQELNL